MSDEAALRTRARPRPVPGRATPAGTRAQVAAPHTHLPGRDLVVSRLGLGLRGLDPRAPAHHRAVAEGLRRGLNLLDLDAIARGRGPAALAGQLLRSEEIPREGVVLAGRVGPGLPAAPTPAQLGAALDALAAAAGVERLDLAIVEIPPDTPEGALLAAAHACEARVQAGDLAGYLLSFGDVVEGADLAARIEALTDRRHLVAVQLPVDLERAAALLGNPPLPERLQRVGVGLFAEEPHGGSAMGTSPTPLDAPVQAAARAARRLEGRWAAGLGARLRVGDGTAADLFRWGQVIEAFVASAPSTRAWEELRAGTIAPHLGRASAELLRALDGAERAAFQEWWVAYAAAIHALYDAVEAALAHRARLAADPLRERLARSAPAAWQAASLPQMRVAASLTAGADLVWGRACAAAEVDALCGALDLLSPKVSCDDARDLLRATSAR